MITAEEAGKLSSPNHRLDSNQMAYIDKINHHILKEIHSPSPHNSYSRTKTCFIEFTRHMLNGSSMQSMNIQEVIKFLEKHGYEVRTTLSSGRSGLTVSWEVPRESLR